MQAGMHARTYTCTETSWQPLRYTIRRMRNPFLDAFHELVITYRHSLVAALRTSVDTCTKQYEDRNATEQCGTYISGQLYIVSAQNRDGDLAEFLAHEIQLFPHSLSNCGKFHLPSTESDLLRCLELPGQPEPPLTHDRKITDRAVIVHCLSTRGSTSHMQTRY